MTLPGMRMIIVLMLVMSLGNVLNAGLNTIGTSSPSTIFQNAMMMVFCKALLKPGRLNTKRKLHPGGRALHWRHRQPGPEQPGAGQHLLPGGQPVLPSYGVVNSTGKSFTSPAAAAVLLEKDRASTWIKPGQCAERGL